MASRIIGFCKTDSETLAFGNPAMALPQDPLQVNLPHLGIGNARPALRQAHPRAGCPDRWLFLFQLGKAGIITARAALRKTGIAGNARPSANAFRISGVKGMFFAADP